MVRDIDKQNELTKKHIPHAVVLVFMVLMHLR